MDQPVVIVSGASRGLGAAIALEAARLGANIVLAARSRDRLMEVAQQIEGIGSQALAVQGDVRQEEDCRNIVQQALERFGRIDALVNNAGVLEPIAPIAEACLQEWWDNWAVNVMGAVMLIQMSLPHLRQSRGRVVNISSGAAVNAIGGWGAYSIAKAAINHLTLILASEEADITALAVRPGVVDTEMQALIREKGKGRMAESHYQRLYSYYESGQLLPPHVPGRAIACLALYAPHEWSGETLPWDDPRVGQLMQTSA